jgi:uncharacterized protein YvpB/nucleoid-associated protein YgaU
MDRHNVWRVTGERARPAADHRWQGATSARYRPVEAPVAIDRPRAEQTWPAPIEVRTTPPRVTASDAHPDWPGRRRPAVPAYQRRLDRHTDGIVRSFRVHQEQRTVCGRRRGLTTHRRPVALMRETVCLGRGTEAHYRNLYGECRPVYRRFRMGGEIMLGERISEWLGAVAHGPRRSVGPRRAVIAMVAVVVLLMSTVGSGLAQQRYVVQEGDTLQSIADTFGVDPEAIRRSSYMPNPDALEAGQVIVIPDPGQSPSEAAQMAAELEGTSPWVQTAHWVSGDDTLGSIAAMYGHDPQALADFNGLENPDSIAPGQRILIPPTREEPADSGVAPGAVTVPGVVTYKQSRNLSCEYAAVHIATAMLGNGIDERILIDSVPLALNPHYGYRGNIDGWWGNTDDYGVYPEAMVPVIEDYGYAGHVFYSEGDTAELIAHLDAGHPVVVWLGFWGDTRERLHDDGTYSVAAGTHVVTVYGYDDGGVYVSDPAKAALDHYSWDEFIGMWTVLDGMSLAISWA